MRHLSSSKHKYSKVKEMKKQPNDRSEKADNRFKRKKEDK